MKAKILSLQIEVGTTIHDADFIEIPIDTKTANKLKRRLDVENDR